MPNYKSTEDFLKDLTSPVEKKEVELPSEQEVEKELTLNDDVSEEVEDGQVELEEGAQEESEETEIAEDLSEGEEEVSEEEDGIVFTDDEEQVIEEPDYSKVASELGFEGIKNKDQLITKYKQDLEKAKEDALEGLHENLKEAIKFAREGGDFMAVLEVSSIDYDKVSNLDLIEARYHK